MGTQHSLGDFAMRVKFIENPVYIYLVLAGVSAFSSLVFFHVGGSLAEITNKTEFGLTFKAGGAIAGFLLVFFASLHSIERLYGIEIRSNQTAESVDSLPKSYSFAMILAEISETINRLETNSQELTKIYVKRGDGNRLFDGVYSSLLYASTAAITGIIDARFYGNMMEWDAKQKQLRVRYFSGPYNDEIITRRFPAEGPGQGVASFALNERQIQIKNRMESELKEKGEARLFSMISVPIDDVDLSKHSSQVAVLNVDAGMAGVFPCPEEWATSDVKNRLDQTAKLIARLNVLFREYADNI
ncbi:hypothetical protein ACFL3W_02165 [Pseudomonadota bacterium]